MGIALCGIRGGVLRRCGMNPIVLGGIQVILVWNDVCSSRESGDRVFGSSNDETDKIKLRQFLQSYPRALLYNEKETSFYVRLWGEGITAEVFRAWLDKHWDKSWFCDRYWRVSAQSANLLTQGFDKASAVKHYLATNTCELL